jgi:hypothetical protein
VDEGEPGVDLDARGHGRCCATLTPVPRCEHRHRDVPPALAALGLTGRDPDTTTVRTGHRARHFARAYRAASGPGRMFLFTRKRFSGSQRAFAAARRSKFRPKAARTRSSPSSALRKLR